MLKRFFLPLIFVLVSCALIRYHLPADVLNQAFVHTGTVITHRQHSYHLRFPKAATFKEQSAVLSPQLMLLLDRLVVLLNDYPRTAIIVHGYTDQQGDTQLNKALAERRAHAAMSYLESQGITPNRFSAQSHGEQGPRFFGKYAHLNRRIEITIQSP